jgi:hypothetical protein
MDGHIFFFHFLGNIYNLFTLLRDYYRIGLTVQQQQQCSENLQFFFLFLGMLSHRFLIDTRASAAIPVSKTLRVTGRARGAAFLTLPRASAQQGRCRAATQDAGGTRGHVWLTQN